MAPSMTLQEIPPSFPENYTYKIRGDLVKVKEICDEISAKKWLEDYQVSSRSSWTVSRTYPTSGHKVVFKQQWKCHFNVQNRSANAKIKRSSKNLQCPALITATVYRSVKNSKSKLKLDSEYPCHLEVTLEHNHLFDTAAVLRYNRMSKETEEKLIELFKKGHTAATAREELKLELYVGDIESYYEKAADNSVIPTLATIQYLFNKSFKNTYGAKSGEDMDKDLQEMLRRYTQEQAEGTAVFGTHGDHKYVVICTPIMSRAHKILPQASELILVDCSSNMDKDGHRVYIFVTPGPPGGVPVGCMVTDVEKKDVFQVGLEELTKILPEKSFYGQTWPTVIMTDDDLKEREPLHAVWERATLLLCQFHLLKAHWKWLLTGSHKIDSNDRQSMYFAFKKIVHASDIKTLEDQYTQLKNEFQEKYSKYIKYVNAVYDRRKEWADIYRCDLPIRGNNTTNYVETIFRILKDLILERVKAHNLTQLVDFILIRYEGYMERRLIDFAHGRYCKAMTKKYLPREVNDIPASQIIRVDSDPSCFYVPSKSRNGTMHLVDTQHGFCGCEAGRSGKLCRHLCAVLQNFCLTDQMFTISPQMKAAAFEIATGKPPPSTWLLPLNVHPDQVESSISNPETFEHVTTTENYNTDVTDQTSLPDAEPSNLDLTEVEQQELEDLFKRIQNGLETNRDVFVPAAKSLLKNVRQFVKTDSALVSAMHTFGRYTGQAAMTSTNSRRGVMIGVQPTSVSRRKHCLGGKRKIGSGRPPGEPKRPAVLLQHDYTTFGALPPNKRRAPHSLQFCVEKNVGIPSKRSSAD